MHVGGAFFDRLRIGFTALLSTYVMHFDDFGRGFQKAPLAVQDCAI
jgi:hypothetical protein